MRLDTLIVTGLVEALRDVVPGGTRLLLHGSRVDDSLKGGDIDLLLVVNDSDEPGLSPKKHILLARIKERIGDRRVDLTIASATETARDPFLKSVLPGALTLHVF